MVTNLIKIKKTDNHFSSQIIEHKDDHNIQC
jgi:hypothetical protein